MGQVVLPVIGNLDGFYRSFTRKPVAVPDKEGQPIAHEIRMRHPRHQPPDYQSPRLTRLSNIPLRGDEVLP